MKNVYLKLAKAKELIKANKLKKAGRNDFSKYDYFTPAQVEQLVYDACTEANLLSNFDLIRDEFGIFGRLKIVDLDSGEVIDFEMATDIPSIKATNIAQQLGGCVTYTERYLKMSTFGIVDNNLDFDTTQNTKATVKKDSKKWLNPNTKEWTSVEKALETGNYTLADIKKKYNISKENEAKLV